MAGNKIRWAGGLVAAVAVALATAVSAPAGAATAGAAPAGAATAGAATAGAATAGAATAGAVLATSASRSLAADLTGPAESGFLSLDRELAHGGGYDRDIRRLDLMLVQHRCAAHCFDTVSRTLAVLPEWAVRFTVSDASVRLRPIRLTSDVRVYDVTDGYRLVSASAVPVTMSLTGAATGEPLTSWFISTAPDRITRAWSWQAPASVRLVVGTRIWDLTNATLSRSDSVTVAR